MSLPSRERSNSQELGVAHDSQQSAPGACPAGSKGPFVRAKRPKALGQGGRPGPLDEQDEGVDDLVGALQVGRPGDPDQLVGRLVDLYHGRVAVVAVEKTLWPSLQKVDSIALKIAILDAVK